MQTVTVEILHEKAYRLLEDLEDLGFIKIHRQTPEERPKTNLSTLRDSIQLNKTVDEIEQEFRDLRNEWERPLPSRNRDETG
ncbi:MAG: hypothetical protein H7Y12_08955 [Sphingobacteriaceae bacterium]|nr:hypothetical protein [Cytophagaceae bacterium]